MSGLVHAENTKDDMTTHAVLMSANVPHQRPHADLSARGRA
jgi:hypothetical protein